MPVEPNWIMRNPSACCICKSEITCKEGTANSVTIASFHFALCNECLDWMIWKLGLLPPASCIGCCIYHKHICTCQFGILPSWVRREHGSRKSSCWGSVTQYRYWIKSCISYILFKHRLCLPHGVRTVARTSLPHHCWNPSQAYLANSQKTCFRAVGIFKKPSSQTHDVINIRGAYGL